MITITDDDIGKEGRFTWRGQPCVILRLLRGLRGLKSPNAAIAYVDSWGNEQALMVSTGHGQLVRTPAAPRKLYICVNRYARSGLHSTSNAYQTREAAENLIGNDSKTYAIIEIPHPEDAP